MKWKYIEKVETHTVNDRLNKIFFVNDSLGFVIGGKRYDNSTLLRTTDGGQTWSYRNISEAPKALYGITKSKSGPLYIIGFDGKLLKSEDNGESWKLFQSWYLPYKDLALRNDQQGILIGGINFYAGYTTIFSGEGSFEYFDSLGYELNDIEMINEKEGYIAGYGVVLKTEDSGNSWQMLPIENDNFTAIHAYGKNEAWTCGYNGSIFHTTDGGRNWECMRNGNNFIKVRYSLLDIAFSDPLHGYAIGEKGVFLYTDDGGHHWMEFEKFTDNDLRCIVTRKDGSLLVCGDGGTLYKVYPKHFR